MDLAPFPDLTYQQCPPIIETPPLAQQSRLLNIPTELRLIIYDYVFDTGDDDFAIEKDDGGFDSPAKFLALLLTCKLIHNEASALAFQRANFLLPIKALHGPFLSPKILTLPEWKLANVRRLTVIWEVCWDVRPRKHPGHLFFSELANAPLNLACLTFSPRQNITYSSKKHRDLTFLRFFSSICVLIHSIKPFSNVQRVVMPSLRQWCMWIQEDSKLPDRFTVIFSGFITEVLMARLSEWMYRTLEILDSHDSPKYEALEMTPRGAPGFEAGIIETTLPITVRRLNRWLSSSSQHLPT